MYQVQRQSVNLTLMLSLLITMSYCSIAAAKLPFYEKKDSWQETMYASREKLKALQGDKKPSIPLPRFDSDNYSITAWVKTTRGGTILSKAPVNSDYAPNAKCFFISSEPESNGTLAFDIGYVGTTEAENSSINDDQWHHVAIVSSQNNSKLVFYVDGEEVGSGGQNTSFDVDTHAIKIGYTTSDFPEQSEKGFVGSIDDVKLFNRALSSDELKKLYQLEEVKEGLTGHWSLDGHFKDMSGNENHALLEIKTETIPGKIGQAKQFNGESFIALPTNSGNSDQYFLWQSIEQDFNNKDEIDQIATETKDNIWTDDWNTLSDVALRYAQAMPDMGQQNRVINYAKSISDYNALQRIQSIYYMTKAFDKANTNINYIDSNFDEQDTHWQEYKNKFSQLNDKGLGIIETLEDKSVPIHTPAVNFAKELNEFIQSMPKRLPSGPRGKGTFGAKYARLKYDYEWDSLWRVENFPDVIVQFDDADHRFVFWRGTSFIPCWATYDGAWYTNEFFERRGFLGGVKSQTMCEPMSDKQCRYSHVRIIESNPARVVVHWRYTPNDLDYEIPYKDPVTGIGDWVDEIYTFYPDSIGVRKANLHSGSPDNHWVEYQESIIINQPGTIPEDNIEFGALSFANLKGESKTYMWGENGSDGFPDPPTDPSIQVVNFKHKTRPFSVVDPSEGVAIGPYGGHAPGSRFNWWNHWPVAQERSDTTVASSADKPSHTSVSHIRWKMYEQEGIRRTWLMLNGMTDKPAGELGAIGKSWLSPAELSIEDSEGYEYVGYDPAQRAYIIKASSKRAMPLDITIDASEGRPVHNLAIVIEDMPQGRFGISIDGERVRRGGNRNARIGSHDKLDGRNMIIFVKKETTESFEISIAPRQRRQ